MEDEKLTLHFIEEIYLMKELGFDFLFSEAVAGCHRLFFEKNEFYKAIVIFPSGSYKIFTADSNSTFNF